VRARFSVAALALAGILALSGCASDSLASDYGNGGSTSYTNDSGVPVTISAARRTKAIEFTGTTADGKTLTASDSRGEVTVVNFWYANCAPCRAEAPILQGLYEKYRSEGVAFVGVNIFDQPDSALSFEKQYGIRYPSVMDVDSGAARIAFAGAVAPTATPTTFVLDRKGRIAARIVGQLESPSILNTLISDALAEGK
jgi:thiol-disulfide isomerase/thioredoxin